MKISSIMLFGPDFAVNIDALEGFHGEGSGSTIILRCGEEIYTDTSFSELCEMIKNFYDQINGD